MRAGTHWPRTASTMAMISRMRARSGTKRHCTRDWASALGRSDLFQMFGHVLIQCEFLRD